MVNPSFGTATTRPPNLNLLRIEEELSAVHLRLSRTYVENLPYQELVTRYDRAQTFFYIDPPYWGCEDHYGKAMFSRDDFTLLAEQLKRIKGQFILSLNDVPEVRELFDDFTLLPVTCRYSCTTGKRPLANELLILNFDA